MPYKVEFKKVGKLSFLDHIMRRDHRKTQYRIKWDMHDLIDPSEAKLFAETYSEQWQDWGALDDNLKSVLLAYSRN